MSSSSSASEHILIVQNVVCSAYMGATIDLTDACEILSGRLDEKVFPAVVSVCRESSGIRISVFQSGQMVVSGARSELQALLAAHYCVDKLNQDMHRADLRVFNFTVQNIVCSCDLGFSLNLSAVDAQEEENLTYQPESFDGLHWRTEAPTIGFMLFPFGRIVATGMKRFSDIRVAQERLKHLRRYKLGDEQVSPEIMRLADERTRFGRKRIRSQNEDQERGAARILVDHLQIAEERRLKEHVYAGEALPFQPLFPQIIGSIGYPTYMSAGLIAQLSAMLTTRPRDRARE